MLCKFDRRQRLWVYEDVYAELLLVVYQRVVGVYLVVYPGDCRFCAELFADCAGYNVELVEGGHRQQEVAVVHSRSGEGLCRCSVAAYYAHVEIFLRVVGTFPVRFDEGYGVPVLAQHLAEIVPDIARSDYYYFHNPPYCYHIFGEYKAFF